jgi:hypothetical protein
MSATETLEYLRTYLKLKRNLNERFFHSKEASVYEDVLKEVDSIQLLIQSSNEGNLSQPELPEVSNGN